MNQVSKWTLIDTLAVATCVCLGVLTAVIPFLVKGTFEEFELDIPHLTLLFLSPVVSTSVALVCFAAVAAFVTIRLLAGATWLGVVLLVLALLGNAVVALAFALPLWQLMANLN